MIRFDAGHEEIAALLTFLRRRAPRGRMLLVGLPVQPEFAPRARKRPLKTPRILLEALEKNRQAQCLGIAFPLGDVPVSLTADDCLMQLSLSETDRHERRYVVLEVRDEIAGDPPDFTPDACLARDLGNRMVRRLRRRGTRDGNHWSLPD